MRRELRRTIAALVIGLASALGACGEAAPEGAVGQPASSWAYERSFGGGPVELTMRLDRTAIDLSAELVLEEELRCEPGFEAELPSDLRDDFPNFGVVRLDRDDARSGATDSSAPRVQRRRLALEPERTGTLRRDVKAQQSRGAPEVALQLRLG